MRDSAPGSTKLDEMKARAESLWQSLIYARSPAEKEKIRAEYERAFQAYQRQRMIVEEEPASSEQDRVPERVRREADKEAPSPFDFHDYQDFLLAWLRYYKERKGGSLEELTQKTGLTAEYVVRVLKRSKRLEPKAHQKMLEYMNLPPTETAFLDALYHVSESESKELRSAAMRRLLSFASFRENHPAEYEAWRYLAHWYYVAIREMATLPDFQADPLWIQKRLRGFVPVPEIRKALSFLEGAGFFEKQEDGRVESRLKFVKCAGGVYRIALGQFHREMLEMAASSIQEVSSDQRLLLGHTVALPREKYDQVFGILNDAIEKIKNLGAGESANDDVFHVEVSVFPLTQAKEPPK